MRRIDLRIVFGIMLILGGALALMETMGYLENASDIFWSGVFIVSGLVFLALLFGGHWWSAFPGFILVALGTLIILPDSLEDFGGAIFLGGIALSFWYVYFTSRNDRWWALIPAGVFTALVLVVIASERFEEYSGAVFLGGIGLAFFMVYFTNMAERWWALIPAGVLSTLAGVTIAAERFGEFQTAGFFFFGLAITFLLVAVLAKMSWAYWPALVLGIMGFLGIASLLDFANYIWAIALIAAGGFVLIRYFTASR
ncbi:MAG: hypothetical protein HYZ21_14940 [Chloroflexi bacterium]|nr:hypothetical protein [Chloroflexota bacterium]